MARGQEKSEAVVFVIENVRVINQHFFVKNAFKSEKSEKSGKADKSEKSSKKDDDEKETEKEAEEA